MLQPVDDPLLGRTLEGGLRIVERIASGGLSVVYRAVGAEGREAAVKVLEALYVDVPPLVRSFAGEAELAARLGTASPATLGTGHVDGRPYLAMELVAGELLGQRLAAGALPPREAVRITCALLDAIAPAHTLGVVHCDLKPSHVMLLADGGVKLLDLGLAIHAAGLAATARTPADEAFHPLGTPAYSAPEQVEPQRRCLIDGRTDLYAVGVILFELLAGRRPFLGDPVEVLRAHSQDPPPRLRQLAPAVSPELAAATARALEKEPSRRHPDARTMSAVLRATPEGRP